MERIFVKELEERISTLPCVYCMKCYGQKEFDCKGCNMASYCTKEHKEKDKDRHKCYKVENMGMSLEKYLRLKEQLCNAFDKYFDIFFVNLDRCTPNFTFLIRFLPSGSFKTGFVRYEEPHEPSNKKGIRGVQLQYYAGFPDAYMCGFLFIDVIDKKIVSCIDGQSERPQDIKEIHEIMDLKLK